MDEDRQHALQRFLDRLTRRSRLSAEERETVLSLPARAEVVAANQDFVRMDTVVDHACLVGEGLAARFAQTAAGDRQLIALHIPGDMADLHSVVCPKATLPLQALTRSTIWRIPHDALHAAATRLPMLAEAFWRDGIVDANIIAQAVLNLGRRSAKARLAHLMCEMALRYRTIGAGDLTAYHFPATQAHLGDALGLTPIHVNRMVRLLREEGLVNVAHAQVRILDWDGLVAAADFDPGYLQLEVIDFHR